jgi:hypothetical protein
MDGGCGLGIQGGDHGRTAGLSMAVPAAKRGDGGKGGMRKKKGDDVASDRRVPRVSDTRARPS